MNVLKSLNQRGQHNRIKMLCRSASKEVTDPAPSPAPWRGGESSGCYM
ncbi:MAG: hypothetical protein K6E15_00190 [Prevotella sp.]|nr:hypothetical protein [Prevotella sp.]